MFFSLSNFFFLCFSCIGSALSLMAFGVVLAHADGKRGGRMYLISTLDLMRVFRYNMKSSMLRKLERHCNCV